MEIHTNVIRSSRLDLILLEPEALRLSLARDDVSLQQLLGLAVPRDWYDEVELIRIRLQQVTAELAYRPWSLRAISLRAQRQMVGHIGFHTRPGAPYLQAFAADGIEFGYTVFPPFRRRGYAREACQALMKWAHGERQISDFIVSIAPDNIPSRRLAQQLGFIQVGMHVDEEDGPEAIFRLRYQPIDFP